MQMVEQLVACQQEMQQHHAAALSFYQTMMTQEYGKLGQDVNHDMQDAS
jgi:hypothetical protein